MFIVVVVRQCKLTQSTLSTAPRPARFRAACPRYTAFHLAARPYALRFLQSPTVQWFGAAALGAAHAAAFAPLNFWWLQPFALAGLFALAFETSPRRAALLGWAFGLGWFGVGVSWVFISMYRYGGLPMPLAAAATAAFCAFLALYPALALWSAQRLRAGVVVQALCVLPGTWAVSEWLRGWLFTGFPWLASGYAHSDGPLAGYAAVVGVYGMALIAALIAGALAACLRWRELGRAARIALPLAVVSVAALGTALRAIDWAEPAGQPLAVRLVQGNVPQSLKFGPEGLKLGHDRHMSLLRQAGPKFANFDLAVLPESVLPVPVNYLPEHVLQDLGDVVKASGAPLIFGAFIEEPRERYFNSAIAVFPEGHTADYRKRHLVPFGEFIPWGFRWFVDLMQMPIGDQQRGAAYQPPIAVRDQRIAINICYEDLFGAEIIDAWRDPERAPTLLLNLSNLAWFDDSLALHQHLQISRLRALETGRPMLRATNTGATAIIDARGRVTAHLPHVTQGVLDAQVQGMRGTTPFVRFGNLPALLLAAALLAVALVLRQRALHP
jgi:apolipoprotein N-acyltransferase